MNYKDGLITRLRAAKKDDEIKHIRNLIKYSINLQGDKIGKPYTEYKLSIKALKKTRPEHLSLKKWMKNHMSEHVETWFKNKRVSV